MSLGLNYNTDRSEQLYGSRRAPADYAYAYEDPANRVRRAVDDRASDESRLLDGSTTVPSSGASSTFPTRTPSSSTADSQQRADLVRELTRRLTTLSTTRMPAGNALTGGTKDPEVDPNDAKFNAKKWMQTVLKIHSRDPAAYPMRTAGVSFRNLSAFGYSKGTDYQKTVANILLHGIGVAQTLVGHKGRKVQILRNFDGLVKAGELCVVLGPPGSGCSTFLKTIAGETHGFHVNGDFNYQGISAKMMRKNFRGEAIYTAEQDIHFPQLTVHETLSFAAEARAPRQPPAGISKKEFADYMSDVVMAIFGISHTRNTRVGNDFVRGVSGGERKRVTIAEAALSAAPLQCWDNSTRGLDSANAVEFVKNLRLSTELTGATAFVAIYQAPQVAYDIFDKALVLYEGRSIYFGRADDAKRFFQDMGFHCPEQQTTPDFLTSLTAPTERIAREGFENRVPRTSEEFETRWEASPEYHALIADIEAYDKQFPIGGEALQKFQESRRLQQSKAVPVRSPYTLSYGQQIKLCLRRSWWRLKADPSLTVSELIGNSSIALIVSSVFYNLQPYTSSFFQRGALIFFAVLLNAFSSALEILTLFAQRPIVEKHSRYALYHPSAESFASMLMDIPYKISNAIIFNCILYFMTNLNRHPGNFFFFLFVSFTLTLTMSMLFRTIASASRTLSQAMAPAAILILALVIYTGFTLPINYMLGWSRWINYINPIGYGFEAMMINEFWGRNFTCSQFIPSGPGYDTLGGDNVICRSAGEVPGTRVVSGGDYIALTYEYYHSHKWRNVGIIYGFMLFFLVTYLIASELISAKKSKGEILVFRRGHEPAAFKAHKAVQDDVEKAPTGETPQVANGHTAREAQHAAIQRQTAVFHWQNVCYDIKVKGGERKLLDHVDGWIKPGQLTALMGVSGAGKTTLLDVLASRVTTGVVSGQILVDGRLRDSSFQRKTGYVQQQDLHLETSTVREALEFSAILRQPASIPRAERIAYVAEVIKILDMELYADAVVGVLGEGLNVEQRKRLTIGVELAAKPQLLFFLDEPTSGLDSQTSWSILNLLEKLTHNGQAILCTIHQPSAMLFSRFDRLLLLGMGGRTLYFGNIGKSSCVLIDYLESNGAERCPPEANPAEWMLQVTGTSPGNGAANDWHVVWKQSPEYTEVQQHLAELLGRKSNETDEVKSNEDTASYKPFAAPVSVQVQQVTKRIFQQTWRTPSYIYSKAVLCVLVALFVGFSFFNQPTSYQGLQNQMFAFFLVLTVFGQMVQQIMPHFVRQRELYEARERPSKTYSWPVFMLSNIISELPYDVLMGTMIFFCWYYPLGMYHNATYTNTVHARGALMWAYLVQFMLFTSTFTYLVIAAIPTAETAGNIANILFSLTLLFCGVMATPEQMPGFWIFMYRVSPFTYMVAGVLATGLANAPVNCSALELVTLQPPSSQTCGQYLDPYAMAAGARLLNPAASVNCQLCPVASTNAFLDTIDARYNLRLRNFGIVWSYIVFNFAGAFFLYWLGRVPKTSSGIKGHGKRNKKSAMSEKAGNIEKSQ